MGFRNELMWPSRSGAVPDVSNVRRTTDSDTRRARVSRFDSVNNRPQFWEQPAQTAEA